MPTGARDHLRRGLESGEAQRTAYDDAVDEIAAFCRKQDPAHLFSVVNPLKRPHGLEPAPQGLDEFVAGILPTPEMRDPFDDGVFSSKARSDGKHRVDRTIVWLPDVVSDAVVQRVSVLPVALQVDADRPYLLFAGRVDCSEVLDVDALCLFDRPRASAKPEVPDDDGED